MKNIKPLISVLAGATVALAQTTAWAGTAASIIPLAVNTGVTYDGTGPVDGNYPVVSSILSAPGTVDGYTYTRWSYLAQDTTGSLDIFYASSLVPSYTPALGDQILVQGNYSPYSGIPEVATSTAFPISVTLGSSGNPLYTAVPVSTTIPTINVGTTLPNGGGVSASGLGGQLLQLKDVTISGVGANWTTHANITGTITDQGGNSMTLYLWASSYSASAAIAASGGPVPTGLVDVTGFISDYYNSTTGTTTAEFVPTSITEVPEPAALGLCGLGAALAWVSYRLRKKA